MTSFITASLIVVVACALSIGFYKRALDSKLALADTMNRIIEEKRGTQRQRAILFIIWSELGTPFTGLRTGLQGVYHLSKERVGSFFTMEDSAPPMTKHPVDDVLSSGIFENTEDAVLERFEKELILAMILSSPISNLLLLPIIVLLTKGRTFSEIEKIGAGSPGKIEKVMKLAI